MLALPLLMLDRTLARLYFASRSRSFTLSAAISAMGVTSPCPVSTFRGGYPSTCAGYIGPTYAALPHVLSSTSAQSRCFFKEPSYPLR